MPNLTPELRDQISLIFQDANLISDFFAPHFMDSIPEYSTKSGSLVLIPDPKSPHGNVIYFELGKRSGYVSDQGEILDYETGRPKTDLLDLRNEVSELASVINPLAAQVRQRARHTQLAEGIEALSLSEVNMSPAEAEAFQTAQLLISREWTENGRGLDKLEEILGAYTSGLKRLENSSVSERELVEDACRLWTRPQHDAADMLGAAAISLDSRLPQILACAGRSALQWVSEFCDRQDLAALSLKDTSEEGRNSVRRAFELLAQLSGELIANAENVWDSDWECVAAQLRSVLPSCQNGLRRYLDDGVRALEERLQHSSAPMDFPERDRYR